MRIQGDIHASFILKYLKVCRTLYMEQNQHKSYLDGSNRLEPHMNDHFVATFVSTLARWPGAKIDKNKFNERTDDVDVEKGMGCGCGMERREDDGGVRKKGTMPACVTGKI